MSEHKTKTKTDYAKALMQRFIALEAIYCAPDRLTKLEFATALRLYADEIIKASMPPVEAPDTFLEL